MQGSNPVTNNFVAISSAWRIKFRITIVELFSVTAVAKPIAKEVRLPNFYPSPPTVAYKLLHWHVAVILKTFKLSYINNCFVQF